MLIYIVVENGYKDVVNLLLLNGVEVDVWVDNSFIFLFLVV